MLRQEAQSAFDLRVIKEEMLRCFRWHEEMTAALHLWLVFFVFGGVFEGAAWHSHRQVDRVGLLGVPRDVVDSWFLNAFSIFDPHVSAQAAFASRSEEANGTRRGHMNTSCIRVLANMLV